MNIFTKLVKNLYEFKPKQWAIAGIFALALCASVGLGLATRQNLSASAQRDCDPNSIDYKDLNGGCGAANATELIKDIRDNNPSDLQTIYAHFGLNSANYDKFASEAMEGQIHRNGDITIGDKTVAKDAWSMGRERFNSHREPIVIGGKTYYMSQTQYSFSDHVDSLPVMVWLGDDGSVQTAVMNPCGNPIPKMNKITPKAVCNALQKSQPNPTTQPNTYVFTTDASFSGNATLSRVVYHFSDGTPDVTKTSLTDGVTHTFTKNATVSVTVYAKTLNGKEIAAPVVANCTKQITYKAPMYVCTALVASALDDQKRKFRFTIKTAQDPTTTVKNADFTLDNAATTTGVNSKDSNGNIYKEYEFSDEKTHTVKVTVYFDTYEGVKSDAGHCTAAVTPKQIPKCTVPGHENLPPDSPQCAYCKPGIPVGDDRCKDIPETPGKLTDTGPGDVFGLFAGTSAVGVVGHKLFRRFRKHQ